MFEHYINQQYNIYQSKADRSQSISQIDKTTDVCYFLSTSKPFIRWTKCERENKFKFIFSFKLGPSYLHDHSENLASCSKLTIVISGVYRRARNSTNSSCHDNKRWHGNYPTSHAGPMRPSYTILKSLQPCLRRHYPYHYSWATPEEWTVVSFHQQWQVFPLQFLEHHRQPASLPVYSTGCQQ